MRKTSSLLGAWALGTVALIAADVWDTKPFLQWNDRELQKVMTDSPWAGKASLTHARPGAGLGPVPDWKLVVTISSALPIKQGLVREQVGVGGTLTPEHEALLATSDSLYVISLSGIPQQMGGQLQMTADAALLKPRGKTGFGATQASAVMVDKDGRPVAAAMPPPGRGAEIVRVAQRGGGGRGGGGFGGAARDESGVTVTLLLGFPKDNPITAQDQEFEFTTTIGAYNVKKTFKLKDMLFKGELAL